MELTEQTVEAEDRMNLYSHRCFGDHVEAALSKHEMKVTVVL
jgi:hypothetical protein